MIDSLLIIIIGFFVIFLAGLTKGLTSFGFALISVPILLIFLSPKIVIPIALICSIVINIFILVETRKLVDLRRIWILIITSIVGIPIGTYILIVLDIGMLKVLVASIIILLSIFLWSGIKKKIKNEKLAFIPVGFISGLLNGSTSMGGPPVILLLANQSLEKKIFRANLTTYFIVLNLITLTTFIIGGLVTEEVIGFVLLFFPALIFGALAGIKLVNKVEEELFKKVVLLIVIFTGLLSIVSGMNVL